MKIVPKRIPQNDAIYSVPFPFASKVKGFLYYLNQQVLYTETPTNQFNVWLNIIQLIVTKFANANSPDGFYTNVLSNYYTPCLLTENCVPLTCENGTFIIL